MTTSSKGEMSNKNGELTTHVTRWTPDKIARFWDSLSKQPFALANCWSGQVGGALVSYVLRRVGLRGLVLDFGSGPGFLIHELLTRAPEARIVAIDSSPESVDLVRSKFRDRVGFEGAFLPAEGERQFGKGAFDLVFFVETIEHLMAEHRNQVLASVLEFLRPGGTIVLTTPNNENLDQSVTLCPDCGALYHRMQHMSSWTVGTLQAVMESCGFTTLDCRAVHLRPRFSVTGWVKDRLLPRSQLPHLVYLGSRRGATS